MYGMMGFLKAKPVHEGTNLKTCLIGKRQDLDRQSESATQLGSELEAVQRGFYAIHTFTSALHRRPFALSSLPLASPRGGRARDLRRGWRNAL